MFLYRTAALTPKNTTILIENGRPKRVEANLFLSKKIIICATRQHHKLFCSNLSIIITAGCLKRHGVIISWNLPTLGEAVAYPMINVCSGLSESPSELKSSDSPGSGVAA